MDDGGIGYEYRLKVTRGGIGGGQDPVTGMPTGGSTDVVVYDGPADWQDGSDEIVTSGTGLTMVKSEPTAYLPETKRPALFQMTTGDTAEVYHPDRGTAAFADGEVGEIKDLDTSVTVRRRR